MLSETEKAYLAGLFDGDGCVVINRIKLPGRPSPAFCLTVQYAQKECSILERWRDKLGLGTIYHKHKAGTNEWTMNGQDAETFLKMILPYLDLKRAEAEIGLKFRKTQHGRARSQAVPGPITKLREHYRQAMKDAKQNRGDGEQELSPELQAYESQIHSQIGLPGM